MIYFQPFFLIDAFFFLAKCLTLIGDSSTSRSGQVCAEIGWQMCLFLSSLYERSWLQMNRRLIVDWRMSCVTATFVESHCGDGKAFYSLLCFRADPELKPWHWPRLWIQPAEKDLDCAWKSLCCCCFLLKGVEMRHRRLSISWECLRPPPHFKLWCGLIKLDEKLWGQAAGLER